jgi:Flp pilus assembly protein TadB
MLAIVAAALFLIALIVELVGFTLGVITVPVLVTAGLLCLALHLAGLGANRRVFARR